MADPNSIETNYVNSFKSGIAHGFQQTESVFDPYVTRGTQSSEFDFSDRVGEADAMQEDSVRFGDNPMSHISHDRRRITLYDFELGVPIEEKDLIRVATDPKSAYTTEMLHSAKRKRDDFIIDRYFGPAYTGKKGDTVVNFVQGASDTAKHDILVGEQSNGSSNKVTSTTVQQAESRLAMVAGSVEGISVGSEFTGFGAAAATGGTGLTIEKLRALRTTMLQLEAIQQDTVLNCFITARQFDDLLSEEKIINSDYAVRKALAEGSITTFMGYRFIHSERLPLAGSERRCIVSLPKAFQLNIGKDTGGDMWRLPGKKKIPYIYFKQCIGGTRNWGEIAAEIRCAE